MRVLSVMFYLKGYGKDKMEEVIPICKEIYNLSKSKTKEILNNMEKEKYFEKANDAFILKDFGKLTSFPVLKTMGVMKGSPFIRDSKFKFLILISKFHEKNKGVKIQRKNLKDCLNFCKVISQDHKNYLESQRVKDTLLECVCLFFPQNERHHIKEFLESNKNVKTPLFDFIRDQISQNKNITTDIFYQFFK